LIALADHSPKGVQRERFIITLLAVSMRSNFQCHIVSRINIIYYQFILLATVKQSNKYLMGGIWW